MSSDLERAVRADARADTLVRDAMLLSLVLGAIPGEIRKMQARADECAEAIESLIERLGDICTPEVSEAATQYYALVQRNRECGQLLSALSEAINSKIDALARQQQAQQSQKPLATRTGTMQAAANSLRATARRG